MNSLITEIVSYVCDNQVGPILSALDVTLETKMFRVVGINLLCWIKGRAKRPQSSSLPLNVDYPWCRLLASLVSKSHQFQELFIVEHDSIDFSPRVGEVERGEIQAFVDDRFRPILMR